MQEPVLAVLLGLQLLLLMRQSLLLLRPLCDLPSNPPTRVNAWRHPTYIQRIRRHGSGAALTFLLILSLLFFSPSLFALFSTHKILLVLSAVWAIIHFSALIATGFRHFSGLAFSSRDAGPADFGRRWPFWPDGILWLCELGYLGLLYLAFVLTSPDLPFVTVIKTIFLAMLLFVYWQNWKIHGTNKQQGYCAKFMELERKGDTSAPLYVLRLRLPFPKKQTTLQKSPQELPQLLPMGFCILHFTDPKGRRIPRWKQNEHPLSLLNSSQNAHYIELEFALEMKGFLQYLDPQQLAYTETRVWGPYYDAQPEFLRQIEREGRLLYIGCQSGLAPLLQYLEWLKQNPPPSRLQIVLLCLLEKDCPSFWAARLEQAVSHLPPTVRFWAEELPVPPYLSRLYCAKDATHSVDNSRLHRTAWRLTTWQNFRTEKEGEQFQQAVADWLLRLYKQGFGEQSPQNLQFCDSDCALLPLPSFIGRLRECFLYRGPSELGKLLEPCLEPQFWAVPHSGNETLKNRQEMRREQSV